VAFFAPTGLNPACGIIGAMPTDEDHIRRILREAGEPLWASEITERLNGEVGAAAYTVDKIAGRLMTMSEIRSLPDGRWELVRP
jgi:hypothetical protein